MSDTVTPRRISGLGWIPDLPDARDLYRVPFPRFGLMEHPPSLDMRDRFAPPYSQGRLGSCTAHGIAAAIDFDRRKQGFAPLWTPSRLLIYYLERTIEGTIGQDAGASIRDGIKACAAYGVCDEALWPYDIAKFDQPPTAKAVAAAAKDLITNYRTVPQTVDDICDTLLGGFPVIFGFTVYNSFDHIGGDGVMPMPNFSSEHTVGGHCVVCCGYDETKHTFTCRNSWGSHWGDSGYFHMPMGYLTNPNLASDLWCINTVED